MTDLFDVETTTTTSLDMRRLQRKKRRATRRKWTLVVVAVALVLFAIGGSVGYNFFRDTFKTTSTEIADYEGAGQGVVQVVVNPGDSGSQIAQSLYDAGVIASTTAYTREAASNPEANGIIPGYYFMHKEMKASYALEALLDPDNRDLRTITVPEGLTLEAYFTRIADLTDTSVEDVAAAAENTAALGLPDEADGKLEGWLFPSTYEFNPGATPTDVMAEMVKMTVKELDKAGVKPEDRERILIIASLVEREAKIPEDRPKIAGVVYNRLNIDMLLQLDSTVKYVRPSEGVFTSDEDRAFDSPYNTYKYKGLPPTPIAGPGAASINAAVNPEESDYLFFVTVDTITGETAYAKDLAQHQKNIEKLQKFVADHKAAKEDKAKASPDAEAGASD